MANEDLLLRQMPHSLEGEQAILGSMLIDEGCVKDVMDKLVPSDFYLRQNREIFETIYTMFSYSKPIDGVTVAGEMEKNGTYEESTTRPYLAQLMDVTPTSANVMEYVGIVRDKALLRETARELLGRYLFAAVSAALVFFCTPFELVVRQTLCIVCFAPLSSLAPIYTDRCHGDTALASFTNSVSIAVSLVIMLALGLGFVL